jgi:hypothetical protein
MKGSDLKILSLKLVIHETQAQVKVAENSNVMRFAREVFKEKPHTPIATFVGTRL